MKQLILALVLLISLASFAQGRGEIKEKIKTQKIAFLTEKLQLTAEEAQQFWPIYNDIEAKKEELRHSSTKKRKEKNPDALTEEEAKTLLDEMTYIEDEKHKLNKALISKLSNIISYKKIIALMRAEREFKRILLDKLKKSRGPREGRGH